MGAATLLSRKLPVIGISVINIVYAVIVIIVGYIVLKIVDSAVRRVLQKARAPQIVASMIASLIRAIGWIVIFIAAAAALGINTGSVVLGLSAIFGLILGFGLQDTIANLAAGVWLAIYRPFNIGDVVEVGGKTGVVKDIKIMGIELATFDNVYIFMPSKSVWGSTITNYTRYDKRRVDITVGVAYGTDLDKAVRVALDTVKKHPDVLSDPEPQAVVTELGDSSINIQIRAWTTKEKYAKVKSELTKMIYDAYSAAGIEIPFPQLDIHIRDMPHNA